MAKEVNKKDNKKEEKVAKNSPNVSGIRAELKKVTWPTRKELVNSTTAVIAIVIIIAIIVFFLDVVFESLNTYGVDRLRTAVSDKVNNEVTTTQDAQEEVVTDTDTDETADTEIETSDETSDGTTETPTEE